MFSSGGRMRCQFETNWHVGRKHENNRQLMSFELLKPRKSPAVKGENFATSAIKLGDMPHAETLLINLHAWSEREIEMHWKNEIKECLSGEREKGCIVTGLAKKNGLIYPSEWWLIYPRNGAFYFQYQLMVDQSPMSWGAPSTWWKNVPEYEDGPSTWVVSKDHLHDWNDGRGEAI